MADAEKKGLTVKIDADLHAEVRQYLDAHKMTMAEFVTLALQDELHPKNMMKEGTTITANNYLYCYNLHSFSIVVIVSRLISAQHNTTTICRSPAHSAKIFSLIDFQLPWNPRKKQSLSNSGGTVMV